MISHNLIEDDMFIDKGIIEGLKAWCALCPARVGMDPPRGPQVTGA